MSFSFGQIRRLTTRGQPTRYYYVRRYDSLSRTQSWVSTQCASMAAARQWVRTQEMREALGPDRRKLVDSAALLFSSAYASWLGEQEGRVSEGRYVTVKSRGDAFWVPYFGAKPVREITRDDIRDYLQKRQAGTLVHPDPERQHKVRKPATATLNNDVRDLRTLFLFCEGNGWVERTPMIGVLSFAGEMRRRVRMLRPAEEARLIAACRESRTIDVSARRNLGSREGGKVSRKPSKFSQTVPVKSYLAPLVVTALYCGFRKRTLLSLCWRHLDFETKQWRVPGELLKTATDYIAPVPEIVLQELATFRQTLAKECRAAKVSPTRRLSPVAPIFGIAPSTTFLYPFQLAARRAGIDGMTFHDCRRIYLNKLRERGVSLETAMALTGHRSVATVLKHYREVPESDLRAAVAAIDLPAAGTGPQPAAEPETGAPPATG